MRRLILCLLVICIACSVAEQPKWAETVAAYEVPLPTDADKARFIQLLREEGKARGFHVDAATRDDLLIQSEVSPMTFNASVWRGDDEESMASAMDFKDRIGRVWIGFSLGQDPVRSARFREKLVPKIKKLWPATASLPIMPSGAIPLTEDLVRTAAGYSVKPSAAAKYKDADR
ncbi:hypothetical protein [Sphingomonas montana]|uniref:hypothetical protein n=1 Tax=Sphingomonas montana TaxID=1843236 RepID=UPI00101ADC3D|nr:hypothetical protein [Sphingomonas montana]